jgi:hypothetical protein
MYKIVGKMLIEKNEYFFVVEYSDKRGIKRREVRQGKVKKDNTVTLSIFGEKIKFEGAL